jgi:hypothetical protein
VSGLRIRDIAGLLSTGWMNDFQVCAGLFIETFMATGCSLDPANSPPFHWTPDDHQIIHPSDPSLVALPPSDYPYKILPPHVTNNLVAQFDMNSFKNTQNAKRKLADDEFPDFEKFRDKIERKIITAYAQWLRHNPKGLLIGIYNDRNVHWAAFVIRGDGSIGWADSLPPDGSAPGWWTSSVRYAAINFLMASGITPIDYGVNSEEERLHSHRQRDGASCGLFSIQNAISLAKGVETPLFDPTVYRLRLFALASFGPGAFDDDELVALEEAVTDVAHLEGDRKPHLGEHTLSEISAVQGQNMQDDEQRKQKPKVSSVKSNSKQVELSKFLGGIATAMPKKETTSKPKEQKAVVPQKNNLGSYFAIPASELAKRQQLPPKKVPKVAKPKPPPDPVAVQAALEEKQRQAAEKAECYRQNASRPFTKAEAEGKAWYEDQLKTAQILALDETTYRCLCDEPLEHTKKQKLKNGVVYYRYAPVKLNEHRKVSCPISSVSLLTTSTPCNAC